MASVAQVIGIAAAVGAGLWLLAGAKARAYATPEVDGRIRALIADRQYGNVLEVRRFPNNDIIPPLTSGNGLTPDSTLFITTDQVLVYKLQHAPGEIWYVVTDTIGETFYVAFSEEHFAALQLPIF